MSPFHDRWESKHTVRHPPVQREGNSAEMLRYVVRRISHLRTTSQLLLKEEWNPRLSPGLERLEKN